MALALALSTRGLAWSESRLELFSAGFFLLVAELLSATEELFLAVGDGEAEDCGVEVRRCLAFPAPDDGASCA